MDSKDNTERTNGGHTATCLSALFVRFDARGSNRLEAEAADAYRDDEVRPDHEVGGS